MSLSGFPEVKWIYIRSFGIVDSPEYKELVPLLIQPDRQGFSYANPADRNRSPNAELSNHNFKFIVDNLRVHHGKLVQAWLDEHKSQIEVFYTSPYSPEINPDEYLNHNLKQSVHSGKLPFNKKDLKAKTHSFMRTLQKHPDRVKKLFCHKNLRYIQQCEC